MRREETLPGLLGEQGDGAPALVFGGETITFGELSERAARVAGGLAELGIAEGDHVALWLPNCPEWLVLHLALARLGALSVAINTRFRAHEVQDILTRSEVTALALWPGLKDFEAILGEVDAPPTILRRDALPEADPPPDRSDPDAPLIVFTSSGTTGAPKLVVHTQRTITRHARAVASGFGYDAPGTVVLGMLPLCGVFGYDSALGALAGGATVVLQSIFDAGEALELATRHRVTHANGSDAMALRLLAAGTPPDLRELGFAAFEGEPLRVVEAADAAGITAYMCYGSTEVQALLAHAEGTPEERAVAGGRPVHPDTEVRVGDDGELEIRGPSVMVGYLGGGTPDLTDDGFLRTGDLGRLTEDGFAYTARRGDALRLGGYLVNPREIEGFLEAQDGVAQAGVVAVEVDGAQRPVAFVVGDAFDEEALIERCRASLAGFKVPRRVIALDALPTTDSANGTKVRRTELRRLAEDALTPTR
jgi:fatty-acyl-CoA synthase